VHIKLAICDDNRIDVDYLSLLVRSWAAAEGHTVKPSVFPSAEAFLCQEGEHGTDFDVLLLDIEMGRMNGVELARQIRTKNKLSQIIFVTGYNDYIADGYDVDALQYLLKPIDPAKLEQTLSRAAQRLQKNERFLLLELPEEVLRIPFGEIRFLDVFGKIVTVHAGQNHSLRTTLSGLLERLDDSFVRVGRSLVVNLDHVQRITHTQILLDSGEQLPLPRGTYDELNRAFIHFF